MPPDIDIDLENEAATLRRLSGVVEPRIRDAVRRLSGALDGVPASCADPGSVVEQALLSLRGTVGDVLAPAVVLELQVARMTGRLRGADGHDRFDAFLADLAEDAALAAFLDEYPVLDDQVRVRIDRWVATVAELVHRLAADRDAIAAAFGGGDDPGPLVGLRLGAGDRHRQGRSVAILTFASGLTVAYKPRPSAVDVHFQEFLRWVDDRGDHPPFRTLIVLDRHDHGWSEVVRQRDCADDAAVGRFYVRMGGLLAILHVLAATDLHFENVVAEGEHPVLVDLETLMHPVLHDLGHPAKRAIEMSVQRVGLLPWRVLPDREPEGVDVTGIGADVSVVSLGAGPGWEFPGTDRMRSARTRRRPLRPGMHRPTVCGTAPEPATFLEEVRGGFTRIYDLLHRHRADLVDDGGPLARFRNDPVRVLMRPTLTYAVLERLSRHPDVLRDTEARESLLDGLRRPVTAHPVLGRVVDAERDDLRDGDIPLFTGRPSSRDLWTSTDERLPDVVPETGQDLVRRTVARLGPEDRAWQEWILRASFAGLLTDRLPPRRGPSPAACPEKSDGPVPSPEQLEDGARKIGDQLVASVCRSADDCGWATLTVSREGRWAIGVLDAGWADGLAGPAAFLGVLGRATGEPRFRSVAAGAWAAVARTLDRSETRIVDVPRGVVGILYALTLAAPAPGSPGDELRTRLADRVVRTGEVHDADADCVLALLAAHSAAPASGLLEAAVRCGHALRRREPGGHRAARAFRSLYARTGEDAFRCAADRVRSDGPGTSPESAVDLLERTRAGGLPVTDLGEWPDHSLGGGCLGRLDVLLEAATREPTVSATLAAGTAALWADVRRHGWRCANPVGVPTPDLMGGLAGIGFGLLRLARPQENPSVLALDPPPS
ncbi:type 2 lanthipeptide synthetase LanM family protein [Pseudonocardia saturnea]